MEAINQTFLWTPLERLFGDFTYCRTRDANDGDHLEYLIKVAEYVKSPAMPEMVIHPEYKLLVKGYSSYYLARGEALIVSRWDQSDDEAAQYLKDNWAGNPSIIDKVCIEHGMDFDARLIYYSVDVRPETGGYMRNKFDNIDPMWVINGYPRFESVGGGLEMNCILPKDPDRWTSKSATLEPGNSLSYTKTCNTAYAWVMSNDLLVNGVRVEKDAAFRLDNQNYTFECPSDVEDYSYILIKESLYA